MSIIKHFRKELRFELSLAQEMAGNELKWLIIKYTFTN